MATLPRSQNLGKNPWSSSGPEYEDLNEAWERARDFQDECATEEDFVCARLLGYLLQEASHGEGGFRFAKEICRCKDNESLRKLGLFYRKHMIICFRHRIMNSSHPSRSSHEDPQQEAASDIADYRMQALKRDHYRCVLTGALDAGLVRGKIIRLDPNSVIAPENTQAVHIFPMSIWSKRNDANHEASYAASVWKAMKRIYDLDLEELDGHEINRLSNIITLCDRAAGLFNSLKLWFEADETEKDEDPVHHYRICSTDQWRLAGMRKKTHALCCRVAHLSGITEHLDKFYKDFERMEVLATDGSSAAFLIQALELLGEDGHT